jgi:hypothetical protein
MALSLLLQIMALSLLLQQTVLSLLLHQMALSHHLQEHSLFPKVLSLPLKTAKTADSEDLQEAQPLAENLLKIPDRSRTALSHLMELNNLLPEIDPLLLAATTRLKAAWSYSTRLSNLISQAVPQETAPTLFAVAET